MSNYLFVDGAYLRERMLDFSKRVHGQDQALPIDFDLLRQCSSFDKAFYYDSPPARLDGETHENYEGRIEPYVALTNSVRELYGWHVFDGVAKRRRSGSSQKEVDVKIAVDLLTNALKNNMERACLIAGDQDFRPVVEAVVREKTFLTLWFAKSSISSDLRYAADARLEMDAFFFDELVAQSTSRLPMPTRIGVRHPLQSDHAMQRTTIVAADDSTWALYLNLTNRKYVLVEKSSTPKHHAYTHANKDMLRRVFAFQYGEKNWTD